MVFHLQEQKQLLGERIYSLIEEMYGTNADVGKITGMMLEMDNAELIMIIQDNELFRNKVKILILMIDVMFMIHRSTRRLRCSRLSNKKLRTQLLYSIPFVQ